MSSVAIITARGGSKRIHKKNIKEFCGRPIILYSIEAALESSFFDEVMVSTDDEEIAEIAKTNGASVPFLRSHEASDDYATTVDVLLEVLSMYKNKCNRVFDSLCCIYPTAPFITGQKLTDAMHLLGALKADSIIPVVKYSYPPQRGFEIQEEYLKYIMPEFKFTRSQDLRPIYHDCGQFYCCVVDRLIKERALVMERSLPYIVSEEEVQDIDTISDWNIAEIKYKQYIKNSLKAIKSEENVEAICC